MIFITLYPCRCVCHVSFVLYTETEYHINETTLKIHKIYNNLGLLDNNIRVVDYSFVSSLAPCFATGSVK